jgi:hypothetical protein
LTVAIVVIASIAPRMTLTRLGIAPAAIAVGLVVGRWLGDGRSGD